MQDLAQEMKALEEFRFAGVRVSKLKNGMKIFGMFFFTVVAAGLCTSLSLLAR